jgi:hypothetical protein
MNDSAPAILRSPHAKSNISGMDDTMLLLEILSWRRRHNTDAEGEFVHKYIDSLGTEKDSFGNRFIRIGNAPILYSCHVDTVHSSGGYQRLSVLPDGQGSYDLRVRKGDGNCLGADDGTGIWLCLQALKANKPGLYIFHRGEECGCLGSKHISSKESDLIRDIKVAVAFDRRGYDSVITHQMGRRCCSDSFAKKLAQELGGQFTPDKTGAFTDTAEYISQIPECTNLSVGYFDQHRAEERQNVAFALSLRDKLLALDLTTLPIERNPSVIERESRYDQGPSPYYVNPAAPSVPAPTYHYTGLRTPLIRKSLYQLIDDHVSDVVALFRDFGIDAKDLLSYIDPSGERQRREHNEATATLNKEADSIAAETLKPGAPVLTPPPPPEIDDPYSHADYVG